MWMCWQKMVKIKRNSDWYFSGAQIEPFHLNWFKFVCVYDFFSSRLRLTLVFRLSLSLHVAPYFFVQQTSMLLIFIHSFIHSFVPLVPNEFCCKLRYFCYWYVIIIYSCMMAMGPKIVWCDIRGKMATKECNKREEIEEQNWTEQNYGIQKSSKEEKNWNTIICCKMGGW